MPAADILRATTEGLMRSQSEGLAIDDLRAIAAYLSAGRDAGAAAADIRPTECSDAQRRPIDPASSGWHGWGNDLRNSRFQPDPGLSPDQVPRLKPRWVFAFDAPMTVGQPVVVGGRVYAGTHRGQVVALDARTGCTIWSRAFDAPIRTAISVGPLPATGRTRFAAYFGDDRGSLRAVDADTGEPIWSRRLDTHVSARITGAPVLHQGRLYVPVSSGEEGWAQRATYPCCSFRGSVAALDAVTGELIWQTMMIEEPARAYRHNAVGTEMLGPAGAAVWSAPTLDEKRGLLYVGTGNSYTDLPAPRSDAIVAIDLKNGAIRWARQMLPGDNYVMPCARPGLAGTGNCPKDLGPDHDFGSSPILHTSSAGRDVLLAGQKSGVLYALDPDREGATLWEQRLGAGSALGGIEWGFAADATTVFVPVADPFRGPAGATPRPGVYAVRIDDGTLRWAWPAPARNCAWGALRCFASNAAASTVVPQVVFAGGYDGHLRAYRSTDGAVIWDFDTAAAEHPAVNGGVARGGTIDNGGPVVAGGMVFVNAGYGRQMAHPGNALFAFSVDGR